MRQLVCVILFATYLLAQQPPKITVQRFEAPAYPPIARAARIEGEVVLSLTLNKKGEVLAAKASSGHPMLVPVSMEAAKKWQFQCWECEFREGQEKKLVIGFELSPCKQGNPVQVHRYEFPERVVVVSCYSTQDIMIIRDPLPVQRFFPFSLPPW